MCKKAVIWYWPDAWRCPVLEIADAKRLAQLRSMVEHEGIKFYSRVFSLEAPEELLHLGVSIQQHRLSVTDELVEAINDIYSIVRVNHQHFE